MEEEERDPVPVVEQLERETEKLREVREGLGEERVAQHETTKELRRIVEQLRRDRDAL